MCLFLRTASFQLQGPPGTVLGFATANEQATLLTARVSRGPYESRIREVFSKRREVDRLATTNRRCTIASSASCKPCDCEAIYFPTISNAGIKTPLSFRVPLQDFIPIISIGQPISAIGTFLHTSAGDSHRPLDHLPHRRQTAAPTVVHVPIRALTVMTSADKREDPEELETPPRPGCVLWYAPASLN